MTPHSENIALLAGEATTLLKALGHPARLMICCELRDVEMSVGEIENRLGIKQPRLSRELGKLRDGGLVLTRRKSKVIFYRLSDASRVRAMIDAICAVMLDKPNQPPKEQRRASPGGYGVFARTNPSNLVTKGDSI
jgi:DNA-binding transcriptional ArsR family regulator